MKKAVFTPRLTKSTSRFDLSPKYQYEKDNLEDFHQAPGCKNFHFSRAKQRLGVLKKVFIALRR